MEGGHGDVRGEREGLSGNKWHAGAVSLPPGQCDFQGRARYLNLLQDLANQFKIVRHYYANSIKQQRYQAKHKCLERTGIYAEFAAHPHTIDMSYGQAMDILQDGEMSEPKLVYTKEQLFEVLELFHRFPVLTHEQVVKLVPAQADLVVCNELLRSQLMQSLPVVSIRLQYRCSKRSSSSGTTQYIFAPALNGCAFPHFLHLLHASDQHFKNDRLLKDALLVENDDDCRESFEAWSGLQIPEPLSGSVEGHSHPRGRPRLTDERCMGLDLRTVVENFVHSRGYEQHTV